MVHPHVINIFAEPAARDWQEGWDEVETGFGACWRWPSSKMIYLELYRQLTHGHGMSPDDALAALGAAYHAVERELT